MSTPHRFTLVTPVLGAMLFLTQHCRANPVLPSLFTDHAVLQRDQPIRIWGTADAGEAITVSLGGETVKSIAEGSGKWAATLPAMPAGGPFTLLVKGKSTVAIHDVMLGEVWVASGQSNMDFSLAGSANAAVELPHANRPYIRLFKVPLQSSLQPQKAVSSSWHLCSPEAAAKFSAVAYYFARDLNVALNVPIGIIQSSWSGSTGEEWTDAQSLRDNPDLQPIVDTWNRRPQIVKNFAEEGSHFDLQLDDFQFVPREGGSKRPKTLANFEDGQARTAGGGYWQTSAPGVLSLTHPGYNELKYSAHFTGKTSLEALPSLNASFHPEGQPEDLSQSKGLRFYVRGNGCFHTHLSIPATTDGDYYSSVPVCATQEWLPVSVLFRDLKQAGWGVKHPLSLDEAKGVSIDMEAGTHGEGQRPPSGLYNGMIAPVTGFVMRGVLWYQGEGNANRATQYRTLLPSLIAGWRRSWDEGDFPFLIVQLPNFGRATTNSEPSDWAELREAQRLTSRNVRATGLVVTIDLGEAGNLHPPRKAEVGQRLALWALGDIYGQAIEYSGPTLENSDIEGPVVRLSFSHVGGLSTRDGRPLVGFSVAGADRKFVPATAEIHGSTVLVSSSQVRTPMAVRYAWAGNPVCNLVNGAGFPASPFRTDTWPLR